MRILDAIRRLRLGSDADAGSGDLVLRRAWPRSADHLLLDYRTPEGDVVGGQWFADEAACRAAAARTVDAGVRGRVVCAGRVLLHVDGADRRLPGLADLVARDGARLLGHRAERRAVVRLVGDDGVRYAKVVRPGRLSQLLETAARVRASGAVRTPRLLAADADAGTALWSALEGSTQQDGLAGGGGPAAARATGAALAALHRARIPGLAAHSPAGEQEIVAGWMAHVQTHDPAFAARLVPHAAAVAALLRRLPAAPTAPIHRDFHDKQAVLSDTGEVGILDLDTFAAGDPALDVANLLVHLELRALQSGRSASDAGDVAGAFLEGYRPDDDLVRRLLPYTAATRVRLACVYRFRPGAAAVTERLRARAFNAPVGLRD